MASELNIFQNISKKLQTTTTSQQIFIEYIYIFIDLSKTTILRDILF